MDITTLLIIVVVILLPAAAGTAVDAGTVGDRKLSGPRAF